MVPAGRAVVCLAGDVNCVSGDMIFLFMLID